MARSSAGESSLKRAVRVLEAFDPGVRDLSVSEISRISGLPLSTAHKLVTELSELGLLEKLPSRRYRVGLYLWELAVRTPGALGVREIALPVLRTVLAELGNHVQLAVIQEGTALFIERLTSSIALRVRPAIGGRFPLSVTSSGLVLTAFGDEALKEEFLAEPQEAFLNAPAITREEKAALVKQVRKDGFSVTVGNIEPTSMSIAVPVLAPNGVAIAALSNVAPSDNYDTRRILSVLNPAASAIAEGLRRRYFGA